MPSFDLDRRTFLQATLAAGAATCVSPSLVVAQGRGDVLLLVQELGPNSLDMHGVGSNQTVNGLAWNCYDRLMTYAPKTLADGTVSYDRQALAPELAESWQVAADGMSCTFKLRKDATFHDGTPVTADDVKWSFDRAVSVGGFPTFQMSAGSLEKPEQFVAVDDQTFRVDFVRKDKMLMFNLAVVVPFVINSALAKKNATAADPWSMAWLRNNEAGGGAYRVESWRPGSETILARFLPMVLNRFSGWLDYPEYYFFWNLHGNNSIFNISAYKNEAMDRLIDRARFTDDPAEYDKSVKDFVALCMQEVPVIPLNQPIHDVAMQKTVGGYEFWFHREPDFRQFQKG
jgi:ABC-type transport system substrate-binding protein